MDLNTYSARALRLAPVLGFPGDLHHAALGMMSEVGEVADCLKKQLAAGKPIDRTALKLELGDITWYLNLAIVSAGLTWEEVLAANDAKLTARYPEGKFSLARSEIRDEAAEQEAVSAAANR